MNNVVCYAGVACEPFEHKHIENKVKNGLAFSEQRNSLTKLRVVADSEMQLKDFSILVKKGAWVYVPGESFKTDWAKKEYSLSGQKFVLVPNSAVILVESEQESLALDPRVTSTGSTAFTPDLKQLSLFEG